MTRAYALSPCKYGIYGGRLARPDIRTMICLHGKKCLKSEWMGELSSSNTVDVPR
jgi:hypothetical protein